MVPEVLLGVVLEMGNVALESSAAMLTDTGLAHSRQMQSHCRGY